MKRFAFIVLLAMTGCGQTTVIVPSGTPVMLAEPAVVKIYVKDSTGKWVAGTNRATIPAGWVAFSPDTLKGTTKP